MTNHLSEKEFILQKNVIVDCNLGYFVKYFYHLHELLCLFNKIWACSVYIWPHGILWEYTKINQSQVTACMCVCMYAHTHIFTMSYWFSDYPAGKFTQWMLSKNSKIRLKCHVMTTLVLNKAITYVGDFDYKLCKT